MLVLGTLLNGEVSWGSHFLCVKNSRVMWAFYSGNFYSGPLGSWNPESKFGDVDIGPSDASHALVDGCHVVTGKEEGV